MSPTKMDREFERFHLVVTGRTAQVVTQGVDLRNDAEAAFRVFRTIAARAVLVHGQWPIDKRPSSRRTRANGRGRAVARRRAPPQARVAVAQFRQRSNDPPGPKQELGRQTRRLRLQKEPSSSSPLHSACDLHDDSSNDEI